MQPSSQMKSCKDEAKQMGPEAPRAILVRASDLAKASDQQIEEAALITFYRQATRFTQQTALKIEARNQWRVVKSRIGAILEMRGVDVSNIRKGDYK